MKKIALIGNPNSGKTTIFNELTGGSQIIGNWPGVTVEKKEGVCRICGIETRVIDLPGIYSFSAQSEDERVTLDYVIQNDADIYVNIIDADNIQRNLYLTTQLLEMKVPMILVLNRIDIAKKHNLEINVSEIQKILQVPVIAISARNREDLQLLVSSILEAIKTGPVPSVRVEYDDDLENVLALVEKELRCDADRCYANMRWAAIKLVEKDFFALRHAGFDEKRYEKYRKIISEVESVHREEADIMIADYRFGFIKGLFARAVKRRSDRNLVSDIIDKYALNPFLGLPIFLAIMYFIFKFTIDFGSGFIGLFDNLSEAFVTRPIGLFADYLSLPLWLKTILVSGVGVGIQSVMTFIPIIFSMFLMLAFLEDSGYMARAAFVMDKFMQKIGLPGKSFVPMIVGFGCTVPAIMATRTLENSRDRFVTIFLLPLMSCGARLPVYAVFAAIFFPEHGGLAVFSLYLSGILLAVFTGLMFKKAVFRGEASHFVMELPVYSMPRFKHIFLHTWNRLKTFLGNAGKVIVIGSVLLSFINSVGTDFSFGNESNGKSVLTVAAKKVSAVFVPMGIPSENWEATVAVVSGVFSKEAIIGTLNSLYSQGSPENFSGSMPFSEKIKSAFLSVKDYFFASEEEVRDSAFFDTARKKFSNGAVSVYAYLLFILIYFPCIAALGAVVSEAGLKNAVIISSYLTVLAWGVSVLFYQLASGHSFVWIICSSSSLVFLAAVFFVAGYFYRRAKANGAYK